MSARRSLHVPPSVGAPDHVADAADGGLGRCPGCGSELVQPVEVRRAGRRCHVTRRCPECGWRGSGAFAPEAVAVLERERDGIRAALTTLLHRVERARLERDVEVFALALARGQILPEDF